MQRLILCLIVFVAALETSTSHSHGDSHFHKDRHVRHISPVYDHIEESDDLTEELDLQDMPYLSDMHTERHRRDVHAPPEMHLVAPRPEANSIDKHIGNGVKLQLNFVPKNTPTGQPKSVGHIQEEDPRKKLFDLMNALLAKAPDGSGSKSDTRSAKADDNSNKDNSVLLRVPLDAPILDGQDAKIHHVQKPMKKAHTRKNRRKGRRRKKKRRNSKRGWKKNKKSTGRKRNRSEKPQATKSSRLANTVPKTKNKKLRDVEYDLRPNQLVNKNAVGKENVHQTILVDSVVRAANKTHKEQADITIHQVGPPPEGPPIDVKTANKKINNENNLVGQSLSKGDLRGSKSSDTGTGPSDAIGNIQYIPYQPSTKDDNINGYPKYTQDHPYESVYVPHNFLPYKVNHSQGLDMRGKYNFFDKVNFKVYGHHRGMRGYWLWKKQKWIWYIDGTHLDIHNNVVLATVLTFGLMFAVCILYIAICGYFCRPKDTNTKVTVVQTKSGQGMYPYLIRVHTGKKLFSGTSGVVHFSMKGGDASSEEYTLTPLTETYLLDQNLFKNGQEDVFLVYTEEELGDMVLVEFELESLNGAEETWPLDFITICDIQRDTHWYFPFHKSFKTNSQGYDHNVLIKDSSGSNRLFYDNLAKTFFSQHIYVSLVMSENNRYPSSLILRLMLTCAFIAATMAGNTFIYVRPFVDYNHVTGVPDFSDVLVRGLMVNVILGMMFLVLEIATEALDCHRSNLNKRTLCFIKHSQSDANTMAIQMETCGKQNATMSDDERKAPFKKHMYNRNPDTNTNQNQTAACENRNQNNRKQMAVSVQNPVPSPKKKRSLIDLFRGFKNQRNNPAVQVTYSSDNSETSDSDSDSDTDTNSSDTYIESIPLMQGQVAMKDGMPKYSEKQSHLTVPPPPMVPPISTCFSFVPNMNPNATRNQRNSNMNSNCGSMPTILEESLNQEHNLDTENRNDNMGPKSSSQSWIVEEEIWLNRLKDALSDSNLNLVIENDTVILETPEDAQLTEQSKESLVESLQGLLLICKDRNQAVMLKNITCTLQSVGVLCEEDGLMSELQRLGQSLPERTYQTCNTDVVESDIEVAWRKVWTSEGTNERKETHERSPVKAKKVITDRDSTKDFTIRLCENIAEFAKHSVEGGDDKVSLEGLQGMLRSFLASHIGTKCLKPHQAFFLENISLTSLDADRRHSDSSLHELASKETCKDKCISETSVLSEHVKKTTTLGSRPSITDIHEHMGLRPVTRKLSDSVMCVAFDKNSALIEQQASQILRLHSQSRENILNEMSTEILGEGCTRIEEKKKEELIKSDAAPPSAGSSSKSILESVLPVHCLKLGQDSLHQIASASLQSVLSSDLGSRLQDSLENLKECELRNFTQEVVNTLYKVVRSKVTKLLKEQVGTEGSEERNESLLKQADKEACESIIPIVTEHIVHLIEEEAQTLETIDVDLMMMSYAGQFIETIVTNAVLQTNVCLLNNAQALGKQPRLDCGNKFEDVNLDTSEDWSPRKEFGVRSDVNENQNQNNNEGNENESNSSPSYYNVAMDPNWRSDWTEMLVGIIERVHCNLLSMIQASGKSTNCLCHADDMDDMLQKMLTSPLAKFLLLLLFKNALEVLPGVVDDVQGKIAQCRTRKFVTLGEALLKEVASEKQLGMMEHLIVEIGDNILLLASDKTALDLINLLQLEEVAKKEGRTVACDIDRHTLEESLKEMNHQLNTNSNSNCKEYIGAYEQDAYNELTPSGHKMLVKDMTDLRSNAMKSMMTKASKNLEQEHVQDAALLDRTGVSSPLNYMQRVSSENPRHTCAECGFPLVAESEKLCEPCNHYHTYRRRFVPYNFDDSEQMNPPLAGAFIMMTLLFLIAVGCFLGVIRYGVGLHQKIAHQWVSAVFIAMLQHILILEPFKVLLVSYHMSFTERRLLS